jgi:aryl-alcohol dehydrogenase-like predicted oxidoreductase
MTPFSVYQGRWHAAFRDIEAEIIPMCEDQGMAIVPWAALGGGQLMTSEQRKQKAQESGARPARGVGENDVNKFFQKLKKRRYKQWYVSDRSFKIYC